MSLSKDPLAFESGEKLHEREIFHKEFFARSSARPHLHTFCIDLPGSFDQLILSVPRKKNSAKLPIKYSEAHESLNPLEGLVLRDDETVGTSSTSSQTKSDKQNGHFVERVSTTPIYSDSAHGIYLYQQNCLAVLDAIAAKYPEGRFDMIFADPPYFLSNGGITCHATVGTRSTVSQTESDATKVRDEVALVPTHRWDDNCGARLWLKTQPQRMATTNRNEPPKPLDSSTRCD